MNLKKVEATNLDIISSFSEVIKNGSGFPKNAAKVFNRVIIRIDVDCISAFEAIAIRSISSDCRIVPMNDVTPEQRINNLNNSGETMTNELKALISEFSAKHPNTWSVLPVGCGMYEASATFYGGAILNFFGFDLGKFFQVTDENRSLEENIENNIINAFHSNVYKRWYDMIQERDLLTDSWIDSNVYKRIPANEYFALSRFIDNASHEVSFIDVNANDVLESINKMKGIFNSPSNVVYAEIVCYTSLYMYLNLNMFSVNSKYISDTEDFTKLTSSKEANNLVSAKNMIVGPVESGEWSSTINPMIQEEINNIQNLVDGGSTNTFAKQLYLPSSHKIKYSLLVPIYQKSGITLADLISEDGLYELTNFNELNELKKLVYMINATIESYL